MTKPERNGVDAKGRPVYDLSKDNELAAEGDRDAIARLETARRLQSRALNSPRPKE